MLADPAGISKIGLRPHGMHGPRGPGAPAPRTETLPERPAWPDGVVNYTPVTRPDPRHYWEARPSGVRAWRTIWRITEPPILFLLVGTRGNAGNGRESTLQNADVAQLVEHHLAKVDVASSNLVVRSQDTVTAKILRNRRLHGGLAERRGSGLQSRIHGFESRRHLTHSDPKQFGEGDWRSGSALP